MGYALLHSLFVYLQHRIFNSQQAGVIMKRMVLFMLATAMLMLAGCGETPATPTGLTVTSTTPITLSWTAVSGASSYSVYRGTTSGSLSTKTRLASDIAVTSYTDSTAVAGTTYYYQVAAINADGGSGGSNEVQATQSGSSSFTLSGTVSGFKNLLNWTAVSGAYSYNLYRGTTAVTTSMVKIQSNLTLLTYTDLTVATGTTYYYQVAAVNALGAETQLSNVSAGLTP